MAQSENSMAPFNPAGLNGEVPRRVTWGQSWAGTGEFNLVKGTNVVAVVETLSNYFSHKPERAQLQNVLS